MSTPKMQSNMALLSMGEWLWRHTKCKSKESGILPLWFQRAAKTRVKPLQEGPENTGSPRCHCTKA